VFTRLAKLEETLKDESLSEQQKQEKRQQHAQKESEFLRLKRSRLGVEDFEPLKVIGRGAFGEVIHHSFILLFYLFLLLFFIIIQKLFIVNDIIYSASVTVQQATMSYPI